MVPQAWPKVSPEYRIGSKPGAPMGPSNNNNNRIKISKVLSSGHDFVLEIHIGDQRFLRAWMTHYSHCSHMLHRLELVLRQGADMKDLGAFPCIILIRRHRSARVSQKRESQSFLGLLLLCDNWLAPSLVSYPLIYMLSCIHAFTSSPLGIPYAPPPSWEALL